MVCFDPEYRKVVKFFDFNHNPIDLDENPNPHPAHAIVSPGIISLPMDFFAGIGSLISVQLPPTVTDLGTNTFLNCSNLAYLDLSNVKTFGIGVCQGCIGLSKVRLNKNLKVIPDFMFAEDKSLISFDMPPALQIIGQGAFRNTGLTHVVLPPTVERVAQHAFYGCELESVEILYGGVWFEDDVFSNFPNIVLS